MVEYVFFCLSRRRHTRCALVTGVQTCALPISEGLPAGLQIVGPRFADALVLRAARAFEKAAPWPFPALEVTLQGSHSVGGGRSEERRVGKACVSTCRSRWATYNSTKQTCADKCPPTDINT